MESHAVEVVFYLALSLQIAAYMVIDIDTNVGVLGEYRGFTACVRTGQARK
jgi:hypothetical protein